MKYLNKLKINENISNSYSKIITPELEYHDVYFEGLEINEIICEDIKITYNIDIEYREWGIKNILIYNFRGPSEITLNINFYPSEEEDLYPVSKKINISLDWDKVISEISDEKGGITVEDVKIELVNDKSARMIATQKGDLRNSGKILAKNIIIVTNELN